MPKTSHNIVTEFGTFTRTTSRTYTHLVIARGETVSSQLARLAATLRYEEGNLAKYTQVVESGVVPREYVGSLTVEDYRGYMASSAERVAELKANPPAAKEETTYGVHLWTSKLGLAKNKKNAMVRGEGIAKITWNDVKIIDIATGKEVA